MGNTFLGLLTSAPYPLGAQPRPGYQLRQFASGAARSFEREPNFALRGLGCDFCLSKQDGKASKESEMLLRLALGVSIFFFICNAVVASLLYAAGDSQAHAVLRDLRIDACFLLIFLAQMEMEWWQSRAVRENDLIAVILTGEKGKHYNAGRIRRGNLTLGEVLVLLERIPRSGPRLALRAVADRSFPERILDILQGDERELCIPVEAGEWESLNLYGITSD